MQEELQSLVSEGIQIWSTTQEVLEEQARKELEIFVEENHENRNGTVALTSVPVDENQLQIPEDVPSTSTGHFSVPVRQRYLESDASETEDAVADDSGSDYVPSEDEVEVNKNKRKPIKSKKNSKVNQKVTDDALECNYKARLESYYKKLETELEQLGVQNEVNKDYKKLKGGLKVPREAWNKLYDYQKEGVFWLWELHQRSSGGLLGDEMGLGKTVQVIVFLLALQYSHIISKHGHYTGLGPTIIVCPATVIHQWVQHFHNWAPEFRVAILHHSGTHQGQRSKLISIMNKHHGIIITTYEGILKFKGHMVEHNWHYLILDEGHKIRNPTAKVTVAVKEIRTPHRIMLTGSPMQNNLTELWSLFDFTNPGMLGNLATFTEHFANPILQGGFANASPMQEATALSVASTLKNVITPFLLRRMKSEVKADIQLPHKSEQVLFCSLSDDQRLLYRDYLMSEQVNNILGRGVRTFRSDNFLKANILMAITALRKICNHPDLFLYDEVPKESEDAKYGFYKKSGKMVVVSALLKIWKKQGHRTLLFSQGRLMLKIFEQFLEQQGYKYLKMDGGTSVSSRPRLIDQFNQDPSYDVFLLTTRVGGLGVNLTGANRVIIYDPDWNPATDSQARERAWRIGQQKSVTVYRLLCAGTVEEKMYQRQVWKQLLSNKVLIDPTTNKFFKSSDLFDLFSLPESREAMPETTNIFRESRVKIQEKIDEKKAKKKDKTEENTVTFTEDQVKSMKELAQQIAKSITQKLKPEPVKDAYQLELEEQRKAKLEKRAKLKQLSPQELIDYNRWKAAQQEIKLNTLDDKIAPVSFDQALEQSSKNANLYHKISTKQIKLKTIKALKRKLEDSEETPAKRKKHTSSIDTSGKIDGEPVEGLVKRETKKLYSKVSKCDKDNNILEHLFLKKGVSGALEHESVLSSGKKPHSLKDRTQADEKALKALEALKKSRLDSWKW